MQNFWRLRVPFYLRHDNDTIYVTRNYSGTHAQWAQQLGFTRLQTDASPRGFYWPQTNELFFYWGDGTEQFLLAQLDVQAVIGELIEKVGGNADTIIWGGAHLDPDAMVVVGLHKYGNAATFQTTLLSDPEAARREWQPTT